MTFRRSILETNVNYAASNANHPTFGIGPARLVVFGFPAGLMPLGPKSPRMDPTLEAFLENERALGSMESSGRFSLDTEKAQLSLKRFFLPRSEFWLLKMVQAAVGSGAAEIGIRLSPRVVVVKFRPRERQGLSVVANWLQQPYRAEGWLSDFALGLNAAHAVPHRSILVQGEGWGLRVDDEQVTLYPEFDSGEEWSVALCLRRSLWAEVFGGAPDLHQMVQDRCRFCPVPLTLDGRELRRGVFEQDWSKDPRGERGRDYSKLFFFVVGQLGSGRELARWQPVTAESGAEAEDCEALAYWEGVHSPEVALAMPIGLRGEGRLHYVRQGVVIDTQPFSPRVEGVELAVAANRLRVDASHFQVVENQEVEELRRSLGEVCREVARWGTKFLDRLPEPRLQDYVRFRLRLGAGDFL